MNNFVRTGMILGEKNMNILKNAKVLIFGIGGVGSYVCESLIRSGVENFVLVDNDVISATNLNRQIHATLDTIGKYKVDVMKERMLSINPMADIKVYKTFFLANDDENIITNDISYIVDAIDTVTAKIGIVLKAQELNIPIISSMGTGNKLDPTKLAITDIYKTYNCPLAKIMRTELKKRRVKKLKVLFSSELPKPIDEKMKNACVDIEKGRLKRVIGSTSFVPPAAGLIITSEIVKDLTSLKK